MYTALTGVTFLLLFGVIFWSAARYMERQIDATISSELAEILAGAQGTPGGLKTVVENFVLHSPGFYYLLQDRTGHLLAGNLPATAPIVGTREWSGAARERQSPFAGMRGRGVEVPEGAYLFVGLSTLQLHEMEEMVERSFLWAMAVAILLALIGGVTVSIGLARKIEAISQTSRDIVRGDFKRRVPIRNSGDEFDHLAISLNAMLDVIERLMEDLRQVTTDIAHDLRTPLTRLRQRVELAQRDMSDAGALHTMLDATCREIDQILEIFNALLRIAQIESGARRSGFAVVDVGELLGVVLELYRPSIEEKGQQIREAIEANIEVKGDRELLIQLFANLVDNAIRHSPHGSQLEIAAQSRGDRIAISVADNGRGIPPAFRRKVLQRFFRMESSRTTSGNGLGLSLAVAVATLHDATLELSDNEPGLRVTVSLPIAHQAKERSLTNAERAG